VDGDSDGSASAAVRSDVWPTDTFEFTLPFTLPAACVAHHPSAPLYVRGGPDGMLAVCSLTLEPMAAAATTGGALGMRRGGGSMGIGPSGVTTRATGPAADSTVAWHHYVHRLNAIYGYEALTQSTSSGPSVPPRAIAGGAAALGGKHGPLGRVASDDDMISFAQRSFGRLSGLARKAAGVSGGGSVIGSGGGGASGSGGGSSGSGGGGGGGGDGSTSASSTDGGSALPVACLPVLTAPGVNLDEQFTRVRWAADGRAVLASFASGLVRVWDAAKTDRPTQTLSTSATHRLDAGAEVRRGVYADERPVWSATDVVPCTLSGCVVAATAAPLFPVHDAPPPPPAVTPASGDGGRGTPRATAAAAAAASAAAAAAAAEAAAAEAALDWTHIGWGIHIFDTRATSSAVLTAARYPDYAGCTAAFYDDASLSVVVGCEDGSLLVYDMRGDRIRLHVPGVPLHAAGSARRAATGGASRPVSGLAPGSAPPQLSYHFGHAGAVNIIAPHPNHRAIGTAGQDGEVKLWSLPDLEACASAPRLHAVKRELVTPGVKHARSTWMQPSGVSSLLLTEEYLVTTGWDGATYASPLLW